MLKIILNGKEQDTSAVNVAELISDMQLPKFFVVEKNNNVVYKENYKNEILNNGDNIEIASFCGGG